MSLLATCLSVAAVLASPDRAVALKEIPEIDQVPTGSTVGDFDGNGIQDVVVAVPGEDIGTAALSAGAVNVIYGRTGGLSATANQLWHQDVPGVKGLAERGDRCASSVAAGDFNGDGRDDLAIGCPGESIGGVELMGAVNLLYGSSRGLAVAANEIVTTTGIGAVGSPDRFGREVVSGDFDADGYDDLAIMAPGDYVFSTVKKGTVLFLYGSGSGITADGHSFNTSFRDEYPIVQNSLVTGDFDGDGADDLAGITRNGTQVLYSSGNATRLPYEINGYTLARGDFDGDGSDDLAIGDPMEPVSGREEAGVVRIVYGSTLGLDVDRQQLWHQSSVGIKDGAEATDWFGYEMAGGDFDGDGRDDLAIAALETIRNMGCCDEGVVHALYGGPNGLTTRDQLWHQGLPSVPGGAEPGDQFGANLVSGRFDGGATEDLAVGVPFETIGRRNPYAGATSVIYGGENGLTGAASQLWYQDSAGISGVGEAWDNFGGPPSEEPSSYSGY
jgi:hypothetical protein